MGVGYQGGSQNAIEIELRLLQQQFYKDLELTDKTIKGLAVKLDRAFGRQQQQSAFTSGQKKINAELEKFEKTQGRIEKMMERQKRVHQDPMRTAGIFGAAALAAGGTLGQAAGLSGLVHVISSLGQKITAGRDLGQARRRLRTATAAGDVEGMQEAGADVASGQGMAAAATKNLVVAAASAAAVAVVRSGQMGAVNEASERMLFQTTGISKSGFLEAGRRGEFSALGLNPNEALGLANQIGRTGAVTDNGQLGASGLFGSVAKMKLQYGDQAMPEVMGLLSSGVRGGAISGSGASRDRQARDLLARAVGVAVSTNLEKSRIGESLQTMAQLQESLPAGVAARPDLAADILSAVGGLGNQFKGAGGMSTAQNVQNILTGKGGNISKMLAMQSTLGAGGVTDPLSLFMGMENPDMGGMKKTLESMGMGDANNKRALAFSMFQGGEAPSATSALASLDAILGGKKGVTAPGGAGATGIGGLGEEMPKSLMDMKKAADDISTAGQILGQTFRETLTPATEVAAKAIKDLAEDINYISKRAGFWDAVKGTLKEAPGGFMDALRFFKPEVGSGGDTSLGAASKAAENEAKRHVIEIHTSPTVDQKIRATVVDQAAQSKNAPGGVGTSRVR